MKSIKGLFKSQGGKRLLLLFLASIGLILALLPSIRENSIGSSKVYNDSTEAKLKGILESVTGEGTIDVMITYESSYASPENEEVLFYGAQNKSIEQKNEICGVMIVCRGITDTNDFEIIKRAASTALGTDQNKIYIIGGANKQ